MIDKIKARLGSLSAARINEMPKSAQRLLEEDMPWLIAEVERLSKYDNTAFEDTLRAAQDMAMVSGEASH